jgi:hypothetical protein
MRLLERSDRSLGLPTEIAIDGDIEQFLERTHLAPGRAAAKEGKRFRLISGHDELPIDLTEAINAESTRGRRCQVDAGIIRRDETVVCFLATPALAFRARWRPGFPIRVGPIPGTDVDDLHDDRLTPHDAAHLVALGIREAIRQRAAVAVGPARCDIGIGYRLLIALAAEHRGGDAELPLDPRGRRRNRRCAAQIIQLRLHARDDVGLRDLLARAIVISARVLLVQLDDRGRAPAELLARGRGSGRASSDPSGVAW